MLPKGNYPRLGNQAFDWEEALKRLIRGVGFSLNNLCCEPSRENAGMYEVLIGVAGRKLLETADPTEAILLVMSSWDNAEDRGQICL